jgi:ferredoxin-NADP reductase
MVVALRDKTATARTITFELPDWPGHVAGQRVDVRVTAADGYAAVRSYSIASAPREDGRLELSVERLPDGEVSPYLTQELAVGDRVELRGPIGGWFVWHKEQTAPIQLIAGGSGIVPLMAMIRSRAAAGSSAPFRYTRTAPLNWPRPPGRIDAELVAESGWPSTLSPTCYVCGPTSFVEHVTGLLTALGHVPDRIRTERFGPTSGRP